MYEFLTLLWLIFYRIKTSDFYDKHLPWRYFDEISLNFIFVQKSETLGIVLLEKWLCVFALLVLLRCAILNLTSNLSESGSITLRNFHYLFSITCTFVYKMLSFFPYFCHISKTVSTVAKILCILRSSSKISQKDAIKSGGQLVTVVVLISK